MTIATDDTKRVLELLAQGKITVEEADQLLRAMKGVEATDGPNAADDTSRPAPRWLRITVDKVARDGRPARQVNIRVPIALARSGMKLGAMIPHLIEHKMNERLREQGIDVALSKIDFSQFETMLNDLDETTIDVDDGKAQVRIRCE
jgi:hypothetical protein